MLSTSDRTVQHQFRGPSTRQATRWDARARALRISTGTRVRTDIRDCIALLLLTPMIMTCQTIRRTAVPAASVRPQHVRHQGYSTTTTSVGVGSVPGEVEAHHVCTGYAEGNCPNAYAYAFDESSGSALWTCDSGLNADYTLTFCPYVLVVRSCVRMTTAHTCAVLANQRRTPRPRPTAQALQSLLLLRACRRLREVRCRRQVQSVM